MKNKAISNNQKGRKAFDAKLKSKKPEEPRLNYFYGLILLSYGFITVLTPNLNTLDSNGPKFYTLAILNLFAYLVILIVNNSKSNNEFHWSYFRTWIGLIYVFFLLVSLLSFFKALNIYEAIINFSKLFTIFFAAYIVSIILRKDKRYLYVLSISLSLLLILDSITVFHHLINGMIDGKGPNIPMIKSIYSNKNILAAAIFVKIPFALWLFTYESRWLKLLGFISVIIAILATLFMSSRAFYIGFALMSIFYFVFLSLRSYRENERKIFIKNGLIFSAAIVLIFITFSLGLKLFYPKDQQNVNYASGFITRLKTIFDRSDNVFGMGGRTAYWNRSLKMLGDNPLLGIGTGNWKIEILKYETPLTGAFIYMYKCHNDFIETATDTGVFGGMFFLGIFILVYANFIKAFFKARKGEEDSYKWLFLPAFGLFCYSFDAFFNFPSDRPEIVSLFALYVGAGIGFAPTINLSKLNTINIRNIFTPGLRHVFSVVIMAIFFALITGSVYIFHLNFNSLKLQRIAKQELNAGSLTSPSDLFMNGFPAIPDISIEGEPIVVTKARYLLTEEKYQQAINLLKKDNSSPYDTRPEFFIAMSYLKSGRPDSALYYAYKVYKLKPLFSGCVSLISSAYEAKGNLTLALQVLDDHIQFNTKNNQPVSPGIQEQRAILLPRVKIRPFQDIYDKGASSFNKKDYQLAIKYFSDFIEKEKTLAQAFEYRAFSYFYLNKHKQSLEDIDMAIALDPAKSGYFNLRGVDYQFLGNNAAACADFQTAINMGDKDALINHNKFCKKVP